MLDENFRIAIADDHSLLRQSLSTVLQARPNFNVIFDASNGSELLDKLNLHSVDIILLDLEMPVMGGFEALRLIRTQFPQVKCLMLSYFCEPDFIFNAIKNGARGFISKNSPVHTLEEAIRTVMNGEIYVEPGFSDLVKNHCQNKEQVVLPFTNKEMAIIRMICAGKTNREIAEELNKAVKTIENHRTNIFIKADVKNVAQLVIFAIQQGIVIA